MPYCTNCGRKLNNGEICSCAAPSQGAPMQQKLPPPQGYVHQPYPNQPYPNQPYPRDLRYAYDGQPLPPPPKPSNKWVLAIVIPFAAVFLITIAIVLAILVPSYSKYKQKAKQTNINNTASRIYRAANTSLADLDADGVDDTGDYIISSDFSKNISVPYDAEKFCEKENKYFEKAKEYDYFIVVRDGRAVYAAASESWTDKKTKPGTHPSRYNGSSIAYSSLKYSPNNENIPVENGETLSDLYDHAVKQFKIDIIKEKHEER